MKAKVKRFDLEVEPMTKYDYNNYILKLQVQHRENKRINGFYCNWNGCKFWIDEINFNKIYTLYE